MTNLRFNKKNKTIKIFNNKSILTEDQKQDIKAKKSLVDGILETNNTQFLQKALKNKRIAFCKEYSNNINS